MKMYFFFCVLLINNFLFSKNNASTWSVKEIHPFYVDVEIFNYNPISQTFEITLRIFMDDAQKVLDKNNIKADLYTDKDTAMVRKFYHTYIQSNLRLWCNDKLLPLDWIGYERENGVVLFYVESMAVNYPKEVQIQSTLLCGYFEQSHILEIHANNMIRNSKLDCNNSMFKTQL